MAENTLKTAVKAPIKVLFVCLGNICRSPTAEAVFQTKVAEAGLSQQIITDSCGTGDWHIGKAPDARSTQKAAERGYRLDHLRARQVTPEDFLAFDLVLAMDEQNLADLKAMQPANTTEPQLFLNFSERYKGQDVPDPYYGSGEGFYTVLDQVEEASDGLLNHLTEMLNQRAV